MFGNGVAIGMTVIPPAYKTIRQVLHRARGGSIGVAVGTSMPPTVVQLFASSTPPSTVSTMLVSGCQRLLLFDLLPFFLLIFLFFLSII